MRIPLKWIINHGTPYLLVWLRAGSRLPVAIPIAEMLFRLENLGRGASLLEGLYRVAKREVFVPPPTWLERQRNIAAREALQLTLPYQLVQSKADCLSDTFVLTHFGQVINVQIISEVGDGLDLIVTYTLPPSVGSSATSYVETIREFLPGNHAGFVRGYTSEYTIF